VKYSILLVAGAGVVGEDPENLQQKYCYN